MIRLIRTSGKRGILFAALAIFALVAGVLSAEGRQSRAGSVVTIVAYNVENLFDSRTDGTEYPEFNPTRGKWNDNLFHLRLENISRAIRESVSGGPDVVVLEEIENPNVLRTLANDYLGSLGYRSMVMVPVARSAINVGVLTRFPVSSLKAHEVHTGPGHPLRNILEIHLDCGGVPLVLFACHWKSKSGGSRESEDERVLASRIIVGRMREILARDPAADVVVAGDLNENVDEYERVGGTYQTAIIALEGSRKSETALSLRMVENSIFVADGADDLLRAASPGAAGSLPPPVTMFSPWVSKSAPAASSSTTIIQPDSPASTGSASNGVAPTGSYWYRGDWETIDQFLLSPGLLDNAGLTYESFRVVASSFLLNRVGHPYSWNTARAKGFSDHLPILLTLTRQKAAIDARE